LRKIRRNAARSENSKENYRRKHGNQSTGGVLVEYNLPGTTGTELRAQLKAIRPDIPVLLFDGSMKKALLIV